MYGYKVVRELTRLEEIEVVVSAKSKKEADKIARGFGDGTVEYWPEIKEYRITRLDPQGCKCLSIEGIEPIA